MMSATIKRFRGFELFLISVLACVCTNAIAANEFPTAEELTAVRADAHRDRFKSYVLKKLEVHSLVQNKRGMCLDFVGGDGLYRSRFDGGPLVMDLANCGEEGDLMDGRVRGLRVLGPREKRDGLTKKQVDHVVAEVNALFADREYDPEIAQ